MTRTLRRLLAPGLLAAVLCLSVGAQTVITDTSGTVPSSDDSILGMSPPRGDQAFQTSVPGGETPLRPPTGAAGFMPGQEEMAGALGDVYQKSPGQLWNPSYLEPAVKEQLEKNRASSISLGGPAAPVGAITGGFNSFATQQAQQQYPQGQMDNGSALLAVLSQIFSNLA